MKTKSSLHCAALGLLTFATAAGLSAGDQTTKSGMRVLTHGDHAVSVHEFKPAGDFFHHHVSEDIAGPYTFLGVETTKVGATLGAQLGLDRGIGLVVARVVPDTGAAEVMEKHDVLVKFEDQLLVSPDQLGVLIRSKEPGTLIDFTIMRGGQEQVVSAELKERKKAKTITFHSTHDLLGDGDINKIRNRVKQLGKDISREEVDQLIGTLRADDEGNVMVWSSDEDSPVVRMLNINRGNVVFTDDEGTVKLMTNDGAKRLVVIDAEDNTLFDGPVETEEQRDDLTDVVKDRLEKVENIETIEMRMTTGEDFEIDDDIHVIVPHASHDVQVKRVELLD